MMSADHDDKDRPKKSKQPCQPPAKSTYLTIGQDLFSINEYVSSQYNFSLHSYLNSTGAGTIPKRGDFVPAAFMVYTDLASLRGLWEPTDYGSGVEYADGVLDLFSPNQITGTETNGDDEQINYAPVGLQIGLWLNGTQGCFSIFSGRMDGQIQQLISYLNRSRASKIFLRLGYEFDNPMFKYSDDPAMYILAFRKIVLQCREHLSEEAKKRVFFVWHSWGAPMLQVQGKSSLTLEKFYPGDEWVDWIGVSIFQQVFPWSPYEGGNITHVENVLNFAKLHHKPTMIAESTPFGGIELKEASDPAKKYFSQHSKHLEDPWDRWFGQVLGIIDKYDVDMWCYINCDWESQPMWHNIGFGETRLASNDYVMSKWQDLILNGGADRQFLQSGSLDTCGSSPDSIDSINNDILSDGDAGSIEMSITPATIAFVLIPFLVASGAFFVPYFILGGHKSKYHASSDREKKPLLSGIDNVSIRGRPEYTAEGGASIDGLSEN